MKWTLFVFRNIIEIFQTIYFVSYQLNCTFNIDIEPFHNYAAAALFELIIALISPHYITCKILLAQENWHCGGTK